ncbi:MAG TPA: RES family NAD+ phosphorylase [Acidobacteriaceae bacterium]|nr:RES family NAD+ phosphorylase [Acidobacteriaceae bacterium]
MPSQMPSPARSLWRISNYASLSGEGGLAYSGRWHTRGHRIIYFAESPAGALLEALVHIELDFARLPRSYKLLRVEAPDTIEIESLKVPAGKAWKNNLDLTRRLGDAWLQSHRPALARVPSAIAPSTWNVLLNPGHLSAARLKIAETLPIEFDPRLFAGIPSK